MDQEQVIDKFVVNGTNTLRTILKILENLSSDGLHTWLERQDASTTGQNKLHRLLNATDPVTSQFLRQEVDLKKVKHYFEEQGLPFAFKKVDQGTNIFFKVKDEILAKKALEGIFDELTAHPAEVASQLVKSPKVQTFEEKLEAGKAKEKERLSRVARRQTRSSEATPKMGGLR
ncbi:DUF3801 domain-containing protein [Lactococcus lactis]|uniref:DUF3801 domain-containing protein n=1 Tax=Lactococcus lactis TaxID=1358 RepID=UPI00117B2E08|nr:DUF3801 domain-containing protein [Lactococcus lactis]TRW66520.1 hypothetical protein FNJ58_14130 [Lactococcus lactis]